MMPQFYETTSRKLDQQQLKIADAVTHWWSGLKPEQRKGYLEDIERHLERTYPSKREQPHEH